MRSSALWLAPLPALLAAGVAVSMPQSSPEVPGESPRSVGPEPRCSFRGTIRGSDGQPMPGAKLVLVRAISRVAGEPISLFDTYPPHVCPGPGALVQEFRELGIGSTVAETRSGSDGTYGFEGVPYGDYELRIHAPGHAILVRSVALARDL